MGTQERSDRSSAADRAGTGTSDDWRPSPWVLERRGRVSFQLQPLPTGNQSAPIEEALAAARLAEQLGFDAVSFGDHPIFLDCWVWLAAVARSTTRIRLGPGVACAAYRAPVATARLAADLDHLSGGRLVLGLGSGWLSPEFEALGLRFGTPADRGARLTETLRVLADLWGPTPTSVLGERYTPRQQPRPPILIAGGGEQVTLRLVARYGDACNIGASGPAGGTGTAEEVAAKLAVLRRHCEAIGRPYDHVLRTHFTGSLSLARNAAGVPAKRERYANHPFVRPEHIQTVDQTVAAFQALADVGIQYFLVQSFDAGDVETFHLLAEEVAPQVRLAAAAALDRADRQ